MLATWLSSPDAHGLALLAFGIVSFALSIGIAIRYLQKPQPPHSALQVVLLVLCGLTAAILAAGVADVLQGPVTILNFPLPLGKSTVSGQGDIVVFVIALVVIFPLIGTFLAWRFKHWNAHAQEREPAGVLTSPFPPHTLTDNPFSTE